MGTQLYLVGKLFVLMGIGVFLRKKGVIPAEGKAILTDLLITLIIPASILLAFLSPLTSERLLQSAAAFFLSLGMQLFDYLFGLVGYNRCSPRHKSVMQYGTVCSNSGILGTPIAESIFGSDGVLLAAVFLIPIRVVMWTLGLTFFAGKSGKLDLKKILTHPCIAAVLIGVVIMLGGIPIPGLAVECLKTVNNCNMAISMILVGAIAADMEPRLLCHPDAVYYSFVRLVLLPLIVLVTCTLLHIDPLVRNVSVVLTAMPAGATTSILALKYGGDAGFASACTALTTVLSLAAVPVWCGLLGC